MQVMLMMFSCLGCVGFSLNVTLNISSVQSPSAAGTPSSLSVTMGRINSLQKKTLSILPSIHPSIHLSSITSPFCFHGRNDLLEPLSAVMVGSQSEPVDESSVSLSIFLPLSLLLYLIHTLTHTPRTNNFELQHGWVDGI